MGKGSKKRPLIIAVVVLTVLITACGSTPKHRVLQGVLLKSYETGAKRPYYTTYGDGVYYSLHHVYGGFGYDLSVSDVYDETNLIYTTEYVDILGITANEKYATWAERYLREDHTDVMVYERESDSVKRIYSMTEYKDEKDTPIMQFPVSGLYKDSVLFIERSNNRKDVSLMQHDLSTDTSKCLYRFGAYPEYRPVLSVRNSFIIFPISNMSDSISIVILDFEHGTENHVKLPPDVARIYAVDYNEREKVLCVYYSGDEDYTERIGLFDTNGEKLRDVYHFGRGNRLWIDEIEYYGKYLIWNHYKKPDTGREELSSLCSLIILDTETDTFYSFRGGFDYYIKDEKLYVTCFGYDRVHNLYEVSFPDD